MTTTNNITGDMIFSKSSDSYRDNYDTIFGKKPKESKTIVLMDRNLAGEQINQLQDNILASMRLLDEDYKQYNYNVFITASLKEKKLED